MLSAHRALSSSRAQSKSTFTQGWSLGTEWVSLSFSGGTASADSMLLMGIFRP